MRLDHRFLAVFYPLVVWSLAGVASAQQGPAPNPAAEVPIAEVSNGCGGGPASTAPRPDDVKTFTGADQKQYKVNFRDACNSHDAGYSGAVVKDPPNGGTLVDFWDWTRASVDQKLRVELQAACDRDLPRGDPAIAKCKGTPRSFTDTCKKNIWGPALDVEDAFNSVSSCGAAFWKKRPNVAGDWVFTDTPASQGVLRITQDRGAYAGQRHITAELVRTKPAPGAPPDPNDILGSMDFSLSKFEGTLKTYDEKWEVDGPVTLAITTDGKTEQQIFQVAMSFTSPDPTKPVILSVKACDQKQKCTSITLNPQ
jgi:hypothetical protein